MKAEEKYKRRKKEKKTGKCREKIKMKAKGVKKRLRGRKR